MKIGSPKSRHHLKIKKQWRVLEIGGGHNPHPRADVIVDKYVEDNSHRGGDLKVLGHQTFVQADAENLPFEDDEFDYVICCHVLEHAENPRAFLSEMSRVAKGGYLEVPSLIGEYLIPKGSHSWCTLEIDDRLVLVNKESLPFPNQGLDFGDMFLYYLNSVSLSYKIFLKTNPNVLTVRHEWEDSIDFIINPTHAKDQVYFQDTWSLDMIESQLGRKSIVRDGLETVRNFFQIGASYVRALWKRESKAGFDQIGLGARNNSKVSLSTK